MKRRTEGTKRTRRPETKEEAIARLEERIACKRVLAAEAASKDCPLLAAEYTGHALEAERALKTLRETCRLVEPR